MLALIFTRKLRGDHRLAFRVVDVGRNDRAPACDFAAHEFGRDDFRNRGAETLTRVLHAQTRIAQGIQFLILADRNVFHFRRDHSAARVMHLRYVRASLRAQRIAHGREAHAIELGIAGALAPEFRRKTGQRRAIAALANPARAQRLQSRSQIDARSSQYGPDVSYSAAARSSPRRTSAAYRSAQLRASVRANPIHESCANPESGE